MSRELITVLKCALLLLCCAVGCYAQSWEDATTDNRTSHFQVAGVDDLTPFPNLNDDIKLFASKSSVVWNGKRGGIYALAYAIGDTGTKACLTDKHAYVVLHTTKWGLLGGTAQLVSSGWYVYRWAAFQHKKEPSVAAAPLSGSGDPIIYNAKSILIIAIDYGDSPFPLSDNYAITITAEDPKNLTNAGTLLAQIGGFKQSGAGGNQIYASAVCQQNLHGLPVAVAISSLAGDGGTDKGPNATARTATCSGKDNTIPCTTTRTFHDVDPEWWDVAAGVSIPGVRETKFAFDSKTSTTSSSVTRHTELYGLLDLYPFFRLGPKESGYPHVSAGVPLSTKSLYRPFWGMSENLTGWSGIQRMFRLPVSVNFLVGMTYMKTQYIAGPLPTNQADFNSNLKYHRVWKPLFGIEIPLGSAASKSSKK